MLANMDFRLLKYFPAFRRPRTWIWLRKPSTCSIARTSLRSIRFLAAPGFSSPSPAPARGRFSSHSTWNSERRRVEESHLLQQWPWYFLPALQDGIVGAGFGAGPTRPRDPVVYALRADIRALCGSRGSHHSLSPKQAVQGAAQPAHIGDEASRSECRGQADGMVGVGGLESWAIVLGCGLGTGFWACVRQLSLERANHPGREPYCKMQWQ